MDNKIILQLIRKDIDELQLLIDAFQGEDSLSQNVIDIALSKAQALQNELRLLSGSAVLPVANLSSTPKEEPKLEKKEQEISLPEIKVYENKAIEEPPKANTVMKGPVAEVKIADEILSTKEPAPEEKPIVGAKVEEAHTAELQTNIEASTEKEPLVKATPVVDVKDEEKPVAVPPPVIDAKTNIETVAPHKEKPATPLISPHVEEPITKEQPIEHEKKILAETFSKEPSLNEKLASMKNYESKVKAKPIDQIKSAIGLNDRFLFQRELFGNNPDKFEQTISAIDNSADLVEAVEYLEANFQWNKNDASLKFMELVKRRFQN